MMASRAGDSIACESSIFIWRIVVLVEVSVEFVDHRVREALTGMIGRELPLSEHAMAMQASVVEEIFVSRLIEEILMQSIFRLQLCVEDRIPPGQAHHRGPPFGVLRQVDLIARCIG